MYLGQASFIKVESDNDFVYLDIIVQGYLVVVRFRPEGWQAWLEMAKGITPKRTEIPQIFLDAFKGDINA